MRKIRLVELTGYVALTFAAFTVTTYPLTPNYWNFILLDVAISGIFLFGWGGEPNPTTAKAEGR